MIPTESDTVRETSFLARLRAEEPLLAAELRPPRAELSESDGMDTWIDLHHAIRRLTRADRTVFLTDDAVGEREEENLRHVTANLAGRVDLSRTVPFLTCKHSLEYCLRYAERAAAAGVPALTVLGGDESVGPPRCVEHAYLLRRKIRRRIPDLPLGGWANPHADPARQVGYLLDDEFTAEFFLTQVVSHHQMDRVERFLEAARRRRLSIPGVFGVFYYRSARPETLSRLRRFFPVPERELRGEFREGATPEEICTRTVAALRHRGVRHVYVSNLGRGAAADRMERIADALGT